MRKKEEGDELTNSQIAHQSLHRTGHPPPPLSLSRSLSRPALAPPSATTGAQTCPGTPAALAGPVVAGEQSHLDTRTPADEVRWPPMLEVLRRAASVRAPHPAVHGWPGSLEARGLDPCSPPGGWPAACLRKLSSWHRVPSVPCMGHPHQRCPAAWRSGRFGFPSRWFGCESASPPGGPFLDHPVESTCAWPRRTQSTCSAAKMAERCARASRTKVALALCCLRCARVLSAGPPPLFFFFLLLLLLLQQPLPARANSSCASAYPPSCARNCFLQSRSCHVQKPTPSRTGRGSHGTAPRRLNAGWWPWPPVQGRSNWWKCKFGQCPIAACLRPAVRYTPCNQASPPPPPPLGSTFHATKLAFLLLCPPIPPRPRSPTLGSFCAAHVCAGCL